MSRPWRFTAFLLVFAALALGASACGYESDEREVVEGEPVTLEGVQYNVIFSRFLNPNDTEDSAYLVGFAPALNGNQYFGVFLEVQNELHTAQFLPRAFSIRDAEGEAYESIPGGSLYEFPYEGEIAAEEQIPVLDSTAQQGPIEGSLVVFQLPANISENRPLIFEIFPPGGGVEAKVTLDL
jgi:hypothetical protein